MGDRGTVGREKRSRFRAACVVWSVLIIKIIDNGTVGCCCCCFLYGDCGGENG